MSNLEMLLRFFHICVIFFKLSSTLRVGNRCARQLSEYYGEVGSGAEVLDTRRGIYLGRMQGKF